MARSLTALEEEIRQLDASDKEVLLSVLLEELDGPPDPYALEAWTEEARRRAEQIDRGEVTCVPAEQVFTEAHSSLRK